MSAPSNIAIANAFATTAAFVWLVCAAGVALLPGPSMMMSRWWMHGMNIGVMGNWNVTVDGFLFGGLGVVAIAWLAGYVYSMSLQYFTKKK